MEQKGRLIGAPVILFYLVFAKVYLNWVIPGLFFFILSFLDS